MALALERRVTPTSTAMPAATRWRMAEVMGGADLPTLESLGLDGRFAFAAFGDDVRASGAFGLMHPASPGKDSTTDTGSWRSPSRCRPFRRIPTGFRRK
jgi:phosphopentomutase